MKINQKRFQEEVIDTTVILNDTCSNYLHVLQGTAFEIWDLLRRNDDYNEEELVQAMSVKYHVPAEICREDVIGFIMRLQEVGYLE